MSYGANYNPIFLKEVDSEKWSQLLIDIQDAISKSKLSNLEFSLNLKDQVVLSYVGGQKQYITGVVKYIPPKIEVDL